MMMGSDNNDKTNADASADNEYNQPASINLTESQKQCLLAVLEDGLEQLRLLGSISLADTQKGAVKKTFEEEMTRFFDVHQSLFNQPTGHSGKNTASSGRSRSAGKDNAELSTMNHHITLSQSLLQSNDNLSASLLTKKIKPNERRNLGKIETQRAQLQALFEQVISQLQRPDARPSDYFAPLYQVIAEFDAEKQRLQDIVQSEHHASAELKRLQQELVNEKKSQQERATKQEETIQQLRDTLQELKQLAAQKQKYLKKELRAKEQSVKKQCAHKESLNTSQQQGYQFKMKLEDRAHDAIADFLGWQRTELEKSIEEWMERYEKDTESKTNELESLKNRRTAAQDRYDELTLKFEEMEKKVEEARQAKARDIEMRRLETQRYFAACRIQRWWRRKFIAMGGGKSGGKGKKKGKGKK